MKTKAIIAVGAAWHKGCGGVAPPLGQEPDAEMGHGPWEEWMGIRLANSIRVEARWVTMRIV